MNITATKKQVEDFISIANPNDFLVYYEGLSVDENLISRNLRKIVYELAVRGKIYLVRKRIAPYLFEFRMIKASSRPVLSLLPWTDEKVKDKASNEMRTYINQTFNLQRSFSNA